MPMAICVFKFSKPFSIVAVLSKFILLRLDAPLIGLDNQSFGKKLSKVNVNINVEPLA